MTVLERSPSILKLANRSYSLEFSVLHRSGYVKVGKRGKQVSFQQTIRSSTHLTLIQRQHQHQRQR